ncbi:META domain-containing protein [Aquimarina sp. MMG016]|uniref:META domain-containing protein n=1 Tax=Aquimarina sp. MMG016 TaxID=2822690 RepID=UPI001B3A5CD6|nr:META domain-containing protein [Aquimarina sp. MMG016]MBQ4821575.1 META domain-containing protein [Aquimarina sp. MMG016]
MKYSFSITFLALLLLINCNSTSSAKQDKTLTPNQSEPDGTYLVTKLYGEDVSEHKLTIVFDSEKKTISGFSGCNTYSCGYTIEKENISFGLPMYSKMYCAKTDQLEKDFFKALSETQLKNTNKSLLKLSNNTTEAIVAKKEQ